MIVVNDGSTDGTAALLQSWQTTPEGCHTLVMNHTTNRGKAQALRDGFVMAASRGFTHAATIDTDGQLDPKDLPALVDAARAQPEALVVGYRDERRADYPARSRLGRRLSNLMVRMECGLEVLDSQCGLRVYPLQWTLTSSCRTQRFCFETEVITRAGWDRVPLVQRPASCRYFEPGQRVSHFRPWLDTLRSLRMHGWLMVLAMVRPLPRHGRGEASRLRRLAAWLNPWRAWREARDSSPGRLTLAAGLAVGAFIANLPLYGLHALLSLLVARRLHLHPAAVVTGSLLSTPPIGPLLIVAAVATGRVLLGIDWDGVENDSLALDGGAWPLLPVRWLWAWLVGSVVIGTICLAATFVFAATVLHWLPARQPDALSPANEDSTEALTAHDPTPATHA